MKYLNHKKKSVASSGAIEKIHDLWFELIEHTTYSPDLVPRDFLLKAALRG